VYVFDLGVNIVGHLAFEAAGAAGQRITLLSTEKLSPDGTVGNFLSVLTWNIVGNPSFIRTAPNRLEPFTTFICPCKIRALLHIASD
jgi:hypothetical protein